ncbi:hypothetical protein ACM66B_006562 [Microbotryomycetes sp. NB124-2]
MAPHAAGPYMVDRLSTTSSRAPPLLSFPPYAALNDGLNEQDDHRDARLHSNDLRHHPKSGSMTTTRPSKRTCRRACWQVTLSLPLVFIALLLAFPWWAYLDNLVFTYLILQRAQYFKGSLYAIVFVWFNVGASWSVVMTVKRGGGRVGQIVRGSRDGGDSAAGSTSRARDEEEGIGLLQHEKRQDELGDVKIHSVQVKANGKLRFCRKASGLLIQ